MKSAHWHVPEFQITLTLEKGCRDRESLVGHSECITGGAPKVAASPPSGQSK